MNLLMWFAWKKPTKLSLMSWSPISCRAFSIWQLFIPLLIFSLTKQVLNSFFFSLLNSVVSNIWFERPFQVLFLIFDVQNWCSFGTCLIHSSTSFFPSSKFSAFAPPSTLRFSKPVNVRTLATRFKMFPKILPPFCVLRFLYRLSPNCYVLVIVTFLGNLFLLTLSNLARKDCPFGNVTCCGASRGLSKIYCLSRLAAVCRFSPPNILFITGPAIPPSAGPTNDPNIVLVLPTILQVKILPFVCVFFVCCLYAKFLILQTTLSF